jgi:hypothetical protein
MPRTTRLTSVLAGRGKAVAATAAAAAVLAGAGAASAAASTSSSPAAPTTAAAPSVAAPSAGVLAAVPHGPAAVLATPGATTLAPATPASAPAASAPAAPAAARPAPAAPAAVPAPAAQPAPQPQPYQVYDSVTPTAIPAGAAVATYADGGYAASPAAVAGRSHVTWIDTSGSDPRAAALDVEPGDATPATAASWTWQKLHAAAGSIAVIYTMRSEWPATQAAIATLPAAMQHQVRWWIADPTGVNHVVPGASATQWYWGSSYDISTAMPGSGL